MKLKTLKTSRNFTIGLTLLFWFWGWINSSIVFVVIGSIMGMISIVLHVKVNDLRNDSIKTSKSKTWISDGRRYYKSRKGAMENRKRKETIYYDAYEDGYYLVQFYKKKRFFER